MANKNLVYSGTALVAFAVLLAAWPAPRPAAQPAPQGAIQIDSDDIGGVVTSEHGPEAGVWVIAETTELGTRFAKMAVTDDRGRYVIPDLPAATYNVWVRGYGLVDSPKVKSARGQIVNLTAVLAPNAAAAAEYYPAIYWFSMLSIPDKSSFPGTGPGGNGMPVAYKTQEQWLNAVQLNGCGNCHQLGDKATREIPAALDMAGRSSIDAWTRRLQSGPGGGSMVTFIGLMNTNDGGHLRRLADWTDRVRAGEIPRAAPPRPHGVERNLVGRVYWTAQSRSPKNPPAYCRAESGHPSAKVYPLAHIREGFVQNSRQVTVYDPKTKEFTFIDTCFGTHHLNFAEDPNHTLWLSNNLQNDFAIVGWVNTKMFWETRDAGKSQGWTPLIVDTNGNGKRDAYTEPNQPDDPTKDRRIGLGLYGIAYSPLDGSIWGSNIGHPGWVIRVQLGSNPSETVLAEVYKVPPPGYGMRGFDVDRQGRAWVTLASGHIASFDRRTCKGPLNGPGAAEGNLCPEGWTFYPISGPSFAGRDGAAEGPYYTWVDQHDILGLGRDVPIGTGNFSDSLHALTYGKVIQLRVPYPMGFFAKGIDGRIDDPNAGWKGRGLWVTSGNRTPMHIEGIDAPSPGAPGKTLSSPLVVHFQLRPDPLAH